MQIGIGGSVAFKYDEKYGVFCDRFKVVPTPNFMLRRQAILDAVNKLNPGKILEMGFGTGICLYEFYRLGHSCTGFEIENKSRELADLIFNTPNKILDLHSELDEKWIGEFEYLSAFEVLEHIQDDLEQVRSWRRFLQPGGKLILSVPAKQHLFGYVDKLVGHVRRYDRDELIRLLQDGGFSITTFYCYGYPFCNLFLWFAEYLYRYPQYLVSRQKNKN